MSQINTVTESETIVSDFLKLAYSRSAVRLEYGNYDSPESYRYDRNNVRRATRKIDKITRAIFWRNKGTLASALLEASKGSRLEYLGNGQGWEYCPGQYYPLEIRWACYRLLERVKTILENDPNR